MQKGDIVIKDQPILYTARLTLRPFVLNDAKEVHKLAGDFAIADTTLLIPHPYEDGMAEQWIFGLKVKYEADELANFAIVLAGTGMLIGAIGLNISRAHDHAEMGYWIGRPFWGLGYCTEAARATVRYAFEEMGLVRIYANHFLRNPASGRVMEKIGMRREGIARQHAKKWGIYEDVVFYGILRSEVLRILP
jgi:[ribosomal protein S5]-alanine N-acetyltransferase